MVFYTIYIYSIKVVILIRLLVISKIVLCNISYMLESDFIMKSFISIKKNREFRIVYNNGKSLANKYLIMYVLENHLEDNRFGVSVSKKVGNSVVRHRITRVIREIIRLNEINSKVKYDIVIIARKDIVDKKYDKIESAFNHLIRLHKI